MLRKQVKAKFHLMKLRGTHVVYLVQENPQWSQCGSGSMGCYSHIALSVTYNVFLEWGTM